MRLIGLGYDGFHDSNVCVMDDSGGVSFAINEERLSRIKKDGRYPKLAMGMIDYRKDDILCVSTLNHSACQAKFDAAGVGMTSELRQEREVMFSQIDALRSRFHTVNFVSHHDCHAASAYFFSGFQRALVVTWDAGNNSEPWNMTVSLGCGSSLTRVEQSLDGLPALDYAAVTAILGFSPDRHEGKVTGIAARASATDEQVTQLTNILASHPNRDSLFGEIAQWNNVGRDDKVPRIVLDDDRVSSLRSQLTMSSEEMANAIQAITEERVLSIIDQLRCQYDEENLCLAGGLFANILINKKAKALGFKNMYVHPAMGDDGLALGACAHVLMTHGVFPRLLSHVFLGPAWSDDRIRDAIVERKLILKSPSDLPGYLARKLCDGKIIALFQGRMEYGPRALGHRSVLSAATDPSVNTLLNKKLRRSEFMPFAPAVLQEDAKRLFACLDGQRLAAKFMTTALPCRSTMTAQCPAVVHVDGTARPQLVGFETSMLRFILTAYKQLSGVPALINTSFNIHEEPIVCSPDHALMAFAQSELDCMAIGPYVLERP